LDVYHHEALPQQQLLERGVLGTVAGQPHDAAEGIAVGVVGGEVECDIALVDVPFGIGFAGIEEGLHFWQVGVGFEFGYSIEFDFDGFFE
jgi:hypothetical protein